MTTRSDDMVHIVGANDTWTIVQLARELYGSADAADPLMAYNGLTFSKSERMPGGTIVTAPYTLSGTQYTPKKGFLKVDLYKLQPRILDLQWKTREIVASDGSNEPGMFVEIVGKTVSCPDETAATVEVYQYDPKGKHILIDSLPFLKILNNELRGPDGKPYKFWFEWHKSMYDWGRPYYFMKLAIGDREYVMPQKRETMLRLKHSDTVVANPGGDLAGAQKEGKWVNGFLSDQGSWHDPFSGKDHSLGHRAVLLRGSESAVDAGRFRELVSKNVFVHHQASHGTAYCECTGDKRFVKKSEKKGKDGQFDYVCPTCKSADRSIGTILLCNKEDGTERVYVNQVNALANTPKALVMANCCLTAITDTFAKTWIRKGTKCYIGWGLPVGDADAVRFAKDFYTTWRKKYGMNPDRIVDVFNAIQAKYARYRPRLFRG